MKRSKNVVISRRTGGVGLRRIFRVGGSLAVCIPGEFLSSKGLKPGDELVAIWDGELKFSPLREKDESAQ